MDSVFDRRGWLRQAAIGLGGGSISGWFGRLAAAAPRAGKPAKSVILLWMNGGPSTIDLWDLKPGHANGGPFRAIDTNVPGMRISENLPRLAAQAQHMALVRSVTSKEGDHGRALHFVKTGYTPQAAIEFPAFGALVAREKLREEIPLPSFVSIAALRMAGQPGGGFLGPRFGPLLIGEGSRLATGLKVPDLDRPPGIDGSTAARRMKLLQSLDGKFVGGQKSPVVESLQSAVAGAVRLMQPDARVAFELGQESAKVRDRYGPSLLTGLPIGRRLVGGVPSSSHARRLGLQDNFERAAAIANADAGFASLLGDLNDLGFCIRHWSSAWANWPHAGNQREQGATTGSPPVVMAGGGLHTARSSAAPATIC